MNHDELVEQKVNGFLNMMIQNHHNHNGKLGNIYYLFTEDKDGNITSEAFGNNVFTDNGFWVAFNDASTFTSITRYGNVKSISLILGKGSTEPTLNDSELVDQFTTTSMDVYVEPPDITNPWDYDSTLDSLYRVYPVYGAYFDYEVFGEDEVTAEDGGNKFYEFGLWRPLVTNNHNLLCRSLVYDEHGNVSYIQKNQYERLYIYCYFVANVSLKWFKDLISNGFSATMNPSNFALPWSTVDLRTWLPDYDAHRTQHGYQPGGGFSYSWNGGWYYYRLGYNYYSGYNNYNMSTSPISDGGIGPYHRLLSVNNSDIDDKYNHLAHKDATADVTIKHESKYIHYDRIVVSTISEYLSYSRCSGCSPRYEGTHIEYPIKLKNSDTIIADDVYTNSNSIYFKHCFAYSPYYGYRYHIYNDTNYPESLFGQFNMIGNIPITDCDIQKIEFYNYKTDDYEQIGFINGKQDYLIEECWDTCSPFYCKYNGGQTVYVWCNRRKGTNNPIKKFDKIDNNMTIFATDSWWDVSSWKQISDYTNIPNDSTYNDAQFYITTSRSSILNNYDGTDIVMFPVRENTKYPTLDNPDIVDSKKLYTINSSNFFGSSTEEYNIRYITKNYPGICNDEHGWVMIDNNIIYPDSINPQTNEPYIYTLRAHRWNGSEFVEANGRWDSYVGGGYGNARYIIGDKIFVFNNMEYTQYGFTYGAMGMFYDVITPSSDPTVAPTIESYWYYPSTFPSPTEAQASYAGTGAREYCQPQDKHVTVSQKGYIAYYGTATYGADYANRMACLIDVTDLDHPIELSGIQKAIIVYNTKYAILQYVDTPLELKIYDIQNKEVIQTLTLDSVEYKSITYIMGWNNHVYIQAIDKNGYTTYVMYNYDTDSITSLGASSIIDIQNNTADLYVQPYATDDYLVWIGQSAFRPMIVYQNDPTNFKYLDPDNHLLNPLQIRRVQYKESSNGKFLLMAYLQINYESMNSNYQFNVQTTGVLDLGYAVKHGKFKQTPLYYYSNRTNGKCDDISNQMKSLIYYGSNWTYMRANVSLYRNSVIHYNVITTAENLKIDNATVDVYIKPIYQFIGYRLTLKTKTIQFYNNPRKITFKHKIAIQWTNDTSRTQMIDMSDYDFT